MGFAACYTDLAAWSVRAADGLAVALATKMPANAAFPAEPCLHVSIVVIVGLGSQCAWSVRAHMCKRALGGYTILPGVVASQ